MKSNGQKVRRVAKLMLRLADARDELDEARATIVALKALDIERQRKSEKELKALRASLESEKAKHNRTLDSEVARLTRDKITSACWQANAERDGERAARCELETKVQNDAYHYLEVQRRAERAWSRLREVEAEHELDRLHATREWE